MANIFIPSFIDLPADVFPYIFRYLEMEDMIAFALTCQVFRQMCLDAKVFRKMDLSRHAISTKQRGQINKFFRDRQLTRHIRELDLSNLRVLNWQMDEHLEFIVSICPHLQALHILNCGMSFQRLCQILKQAPRLTALSWSLWDFTFEDIHFLMKSTESFEGICLKNIKHLHLEILRSVPHIQIAKYLLLSYFRNLDELEIYTWIGEEENYWNCNLPLPVDDFIPGFPQPSVKNELQHLHSLMVVAVGDPGFAYYDDTFKDLLTNFVVSVLSRKSGSAKWKKLCILPSVCISTKHLTDLSLCLQSDDFQSVEAITAYPGWSANAVGEVETFFERIGDNTLRNLHLCFPETKSIVEFCDPILRVGAQSLKFLRLCAMPEARIPAEQNVALHRLFSNCSNIIELDLLYCGFDKDICEPLSELKHLSIVQLTKCAISSKQSFENQVVISEANLLTFIENCKNITHLDVRSCIYHKHFKCRLTGGDMVAFAKLKSLKSLTLYDISVVTEWTFLQKISEHCKFLTTLRIRSIEGRIENFHFPIVMESAKFLKHLAIDVAAPVLGSEVFWNALSHAKNLQRLCIQSRGSDSLNITVAVGTLKSLPRLHVLHMHSYFPENVEDFYHQMIRMLEEKETDCRFSFEIVMGDEIVTGDSPNMSQYSMISSKALPLNLVELCLMRPILDVPRF